MGEILIVNVVEHLLAHIVEEYNQLLHVLARD